MPSLFTTEVPTLPDENDSTSYSLGTVFFAETAGTVTHIRWRFPDTLPSGAVTGALYVWDSDATGTLLTSAVFTDPVAGAWNQVAIVPQAIAADTLYVAVVHTPDGYVATPGFFTSELTSPPLLAPVDDGVIPRHNGKLGTGPALMYPDGSFNATSYFADVVFVADSTPVDVPVGAAGEADSARPIGSAKATGLGAAAETDTARPVAAAKAAGLGAATATSTAGPIAAVKTLTVGRADTVGTARPLGAAKTRAIGRATETATATALGARKSLTVGRATETDTATALGAAKTLTVGQAAETDTAGPITLLGVDMAFYDGPCAPWDAIWGACELPTGSEAVSGVALDAASELLWVMSGRRFGVCEHTLRPCRDACAGQQYVDGYWEWQAYPQPRLFRGVWTNVTCGSCTSGCSCSPVSEVTLPSPVADIVEVRIDGATLAPSAYRVDDYRTLVRTDGGEWPDCNDLSKNDGAAGTWSVTVEVGEEVPHLGRLAVAELTTELVKALRCDSTCALPAGVQTVARAGVTMQIDPNEFYNQGRVGLRLCDMFLAAYNPAGLRDESRVHSIDAPRPRVRTL